MVFGREPEDLMVGGVVMVFLNFIFSSFLPILACSALVVWFIGRLKRGKPPGVIIHLCHRLELMRIPGVLRLRRIVFSTCSHAMADG